MALYKRGGLRVRGPVFKSLNPWANGSRVVAILLGSQDDCQAVTQLVRQLGCAAPQCLYVLALAREFPGCTEADVMAIMATAQGWLGEGDIEDFADTSQVYNFQLGSDYDVIPTRFVDVSTGLAHPLHALCAMWQPEVLLMPEHYDTRLVRYVDLLLAEFGISISVYGAGGETDIPVQRRSASA